MRPHLFHRPEAILGSHIGARNNLLIVRRVLLRYYMLNVERDKRRGRLWKTRSIANFFLGILSNYKTVGGNRNKAIVLPKKI